MTECKDKFSTADKIKWLEAEVQRLNILLMEANVKNIGGLNERSRKNV